MLAQFKADLSGYDFSGIAVWQAHLQGLTLHNVNFAGADLSHAVFTEIFDNVLTVVFSPDGELLAGGTANGEIRLWQKGDGKQRRTYTGHADWVWAIAFSPDGQTWSAAAATRRCGCGRSTAAIVGVRCAATAPTRA